MDYFTDTKEFHIECYEVYSNAKNLKNINYKCSIILHLEVVNDVLAHLNRSLFHVLSFDDATFKRLTG